MASNLTPATVKQAKTLLQSCKTPGDNSETELKAILDSLYEFNPLKPIRMKFLNSGIFDVAFEIVNAEQNTHMDGLVQASWLILESTMAVSDSDEKDNMESVTIGVQKKLIELAAKELQYRPLRYSGWFISRALSCLTGAAAYPQFTSNIVDCGVLSICLAFARDFTELIYADQYANDVKSSLSVISWIARYRVSAVRELHGLVDVCSKFLPCLHSNENTSVLLGFIGARLLIRVFGKDDSAKVIQQHPIILQFYPKLVEKVLEVGAAKNYLLYNTYWSIPSLALDFSLLSLSDTQKSALVLFVPLMIEMMINHHHNNHDLIRYGTIFLSQVSFDESCLAVLRTEQERIKTIQGIVLSDKTQDKETLSLLSVVMNAVFPPAPVGDSAATTTTTTTTATKRRTSAFQRAVNLVVGASSSSSSTTTPTNPTSPTNNGTIQAMISYHQKSTGEHAQILAQTLKKRNLRVWIDYESMKGDIQEAMAQAVQSSDVILVLVSLGYKESANCRLECQYAMKQNKPLLFLVCEESYKSPTGWLGLIMGQNMWVGVFSPQMVESKSDEIVKRLDDVLKGDGGDVTTTTTTTTAASVVASPTHGKTVSELITTLTQEIETLKSKVGKLEMEVTQLKGGKQ
jgi:hypothetical protein